MHLLELFSGTSSVGKVAKSLGYNVISLDLKNADINYDILKQVDLYKIPSELTSDIFVCLLSGG